MKGFELDESGDVLMENNEISMAAGDELLRQKVGTVLQTHLKEWFFDWAQGIDFGNLLGKGAHEELARYEIEQGLRQVDPTFVLTEFAYGQDGAGRKAAVRFKARTESGGQAGGEYSWD